MAETFTRQEIFQIDHCCECGMAFAMTRDFTRRRISDKKNFYCPAGHAQHYVGEADRDRVQRLAGQLDRERTRLAETRKKLDYQSRARKAVSTRLRKQKTRIAAGVCPCCKRHFDALEKHMAAKHPEYGEQQ